MNFPESALGQERPSSLQQVVFPRRQQYHPSPDSWRDEVLYFLLVDRFSDGEEATRPLLNRSNLVGARQAAVGDGAWRWDVWAWSGQDRFQGGTLNGVRSKIGYLKSLGVTALWLSPVFRQRATSTRITGTGWRTSWTWSRDSGRGQTWWIWWTRRTSRTSG